jgi:DNA-binding LacI/PurR family transcriptional regulator
MASDAMLRECEDAGTSVVGIASGASGAGMTRIFTNSERTGSQVAAFLLAAGYRQFALLRGDASLQTSARRARGFVETLERAGEGGVLVERSGVFGYDAGRACIVELVRSGTRPDAVFCASDSTAVGVLDGARLDLGISVPDELAVVGFGDTPVAAWGCTSLTSVRVPVEQIVDLAIEALVGEPVPRPGRVVCVETDIVQRGTVRPVANPR